MNKITFVFLTIAIILGACDCAQYLCYTCTDCNDPFDNQTYASKVVYCKSGCYKTITKIPGQSQAGARGCSTTNCTAANWGVISWGIFNYCCYSNLCNLSTTITIPLYTYGIMLISICMVKRLI